MQLKSVKCENRCRVTLDKGVQWVDTLLTIQLNFTWNTFKVKLT